MDSSKAILEIANYLTEQGIKFWSISPYTQLGDLKVRTPVEISKDMMSGLESKGIFCRSSNLGDPRYGQEKTYRYEFVIKNTENVVA